MAPVVLGLGSASAPLVPITVSYRVTANNDGGTLFHPATYWSGGDGEVFYWQDGQNRELTQVIRWPGIAIPQGATITDARITVWSMSNWNASIGIPSKYNDFGVEQVDNAAQVTSYAAGNSRRTNVGDTVRWFITPVPAANSPVQSPDLSSIVQDVINRPGWSSGNALMFFGEASQVNEEPYAEPAAQTHGRNNGDEYRPLLEITYLGTP